MIICNEIRFNGKRYRKIHTIIVKHAGVLIEANRKDIPTIRIVLLNDLHNAQHTSFVISRQVHVCFRLSPRVSAI